MKYLSLFSGIEAATVAWHPLGWKPFGFAEIEPAPCAVLKHHYPDVPNFGDVSKQREWPDGTVDLVCGGSPCQSFSVAGLRAGMADPRGNLALTFLAVVDRYRPRWIVYENVPGLLSSSGGRDFGAILGGMVELGYGFAYRVLDAQYVRVDGYGRAVPQRRRRVFVVGHLADWRRAAAVLFERACLRGDLAPRRSAGAAVAGALVPGSGGGCGPDGNDARAHPLVAAPFAPAISASNPYGDHESREGLLVAHSLRGEGFDASEDVTGRGTPIVPVAFGGNDTRGPIQVATAVSAHGGPHGRLDFESETFIASLRTSQGGQNGPGWMRGVSHTLGSEEAAPCIAFDTTQITSAQNRNNPKPGDPCHPLAAGAHPPAIAFSCKDHGADATDEGATPTLRAMGFDRSHANAGGQLAIAFQERGREGGRSLEVGGDIAFALTAPAGGGRAQERNVAIGHNGSPSMWAVRRLTPLECERLQGFPDGYTAVPWRGGILPDGPRYKALGNSMACNCMRWIGRRIEMVEGIRPAAPAPLFAAE